VALNVLLSISQCSLIAVRSTLIALPLFSVEEAQIHLHHPMSSSNTSHASLTCVSTVNDTHIE